ncbi:MAG: hypothetical protein J2P37_26080, partial [Ktedonobacteraceae bacterium]|nr:hypothetical protein [Ktedonobacteraceae bacterium]
MGTLARAVLASVVGVGILITCSVLFHLGGTLWQFSTLISAMTGGALTLFSAITLPRSDEKVEPWLGRERLAWILIGCGLIVWGCGESIWRYYTSVSQSPFPSLADIGYASLPPLVFMGLLVQPSTGIGSRRILTLIDSLITMCAMLSIGWYLLLGSLALSSNQDVLAKFLGLYYPSADIGMLSCVILLLFRGQGSLYQATARRVSLIFVGIGLAFFASSDFVFNLQQGIGTYVDGTWVDIGWPIGMLVIGIAAHLRRYLPLTPVDMVERRLRRREAQATFGMAQILTYSILAILLVVLILNVYSSDAMQLAIRPVLALATVAVVGLVVLRHLLTVYENIQLTQRQKNALERLEAANRRIEDQARMIAERNAELERGILHLKDVQARLANGNLRARARLAGGELLPLAVSLNLMAERLAHLEQADSYAQHLNVAIQQTTAAVERHRKGAPFSLPASCKTFPDLNRLL